MKAAVTTEDHGFEVIELPDLIPDADQLVIRVAACGVCGSDIKAQPFAPAGMVMGHELGGEVVAVGSQAGAWQEGANVAVLPVNSCGSCQYCGSGLVSHCAQVSYLGMGPAGGFAEFAAVPARHAFALPAELPTVFSALVEPFAVGLHGVRSAQIDPGDQVLIVGAGGVGLTTLLWAVEKGAVRVTVADPDPRRRESASAMGATDVLASVALRPLGRLVISGACAEPTTIEPVTALLKELTIRYSVAYSLDEFNEVVQAFGRGHIDPAPMIGPTFGLGQIAEAFEAVRIAREHGRVSVTPSATP
jgi:(R,R)-butanediol dehydrogenase / meso-butanediol dehydrogenase / diacetyl reductase